jgi:glyoxylase I family protein
MVTISGFHHVVLTVRDVERSAHWYQDLLGFTEVLARDSDDARLRALAHPPSGIVLGLRQPVGSDGQPFDEIRTGMDHVAFRVATVAELESWQDELSRRNMAFSPIAQTSMGSVIVLRDPDNIQLELYVAAGS